MTNEACITTGEEDILLSTNPEDTGITLSIASDLATTGSQSRGYTWLEHNYHHTPTHFHFLEAKFHDPDHLLDRINTI